MSNRGQAISFTVASLILLFLLNTAYPTLWRHGYRLAFGYLCVLVVISLATTIFAWRSPPARSGAQPQPARMNFTWIVVIEAAALGAGNSYILDNHYDSVWMVPWSAFVVGAHFLIMMWSYRRAIYGGIAAAILAGTAVGAVAGASGYRHGMVATVLTVLFTTLTAALLVAYSRTPRGSTA